MNYIAAPIVWPIQAGSDQTFQPDGIANNALTLKNNTGAVNGIQLVGTATTVAPIIQAVGSDTDIGVTCQVKGSPATLFQVLKGNGGAAMTITPDGAASVLTVSEISTTLVSLNNAGNGSLPALFFQISSLGAGSWGTNAGIGLTSSNDLIINAGSSGKIAVQQYFGSGVAAVTTVLTDGTAAQLFSVGNHLANQLQLGGSATGVAPTLTPLGSDNNVGIAINPKGTGTIVITAGAVAGVPLKIVGATSSQTGDLLQIVQTGATMVLQVATVATAANGVKITSGTTGNKPSIQAIGDANAGLLLAPSGTGSVLVAAQGVTGVPLQVMGADVTQTGDLLQVLQRGTTEIFQVSTVTNALNGLQLTGAGTGGNPILAAIGETNVGLAINPKGTGSVVITANSDSGTALKVIANSATATTDLFRVTQSGVNHLLAVAGVANAVDGIKITGAATANPATVTIAAAGTDANVHVNLTTLGTGAVQANGVVIPLGAAGNYAQATSNQATISTEADLTSLTVTLTTVANRRYRITGYLPQFSGTVLNDDFQIRIKKDGTQISSAEAVIPLASNGDDVNVLAIDTPSAGSHTYKLTAVRISGTGTGTVVASATAPAWILVEDVGS